jgi:hypothetical protein
VKTLFTLIILFGLSGYAAPFPATSTSALTTPEQGLYFLHKGFILRTEGTNWVPSSSSEDSLLDTVRFTSKDPGSEGSLSVRTDKVNAKTSLELYIRRWMRDYPNYGFEVVSAKKFQLNKSPALVVDMLSRAKNKQIRQVVVKNNERVTVMTCMDNKNTFGESLKSCNQIMNTFTWIEEAESVSKK